MFYSSRYSVNTLKLFFLSKNNKSLIQRDVKTAKSLNLESNGVEKFLVVLPGSRTGLLHHSRMGWSHSHYIQYCTRAEQQQDGGYNITLFYSLRCNMFFAFYLQQHVWVALLQHVVGFRYNIGQFMFQDQYNSPAFLQYNILLESITLCLVLPTTTCWLRYNMTCSSEHVSVPQNIRLGFSTTCCWIPL